MKSSHCLHSTANTLTLTQSIQLQTTLDGIKTGQIPAIFNEPLKLTAKAFHMGTKVRMHEHEDILLTFQYAPSAWEKQSIFCFKWSLSMIHLWVSELLPHYLFMHCFSLVYWVQSASIVAKGDYFLILKSRSFTRVRGFLRVMLASSYHNCEEKSYGWTAGGFILVHATIWCMLSNSVGWLFSK